MPDGESIELLAHRVDAPIAPGFDTARMHAAIRQAQQRSPAILQGFCEKAVLGGCTGYIVSFSGRRALYVGRTGETTLSTFQIDGDEPSPVQWKDRAVRNWREQSNGVR